MEAGIFLHMAQAVDAVAHDQTHGAGVVIRPHRLAAVARLGGEKLLRHQIERVVPGDRRELSRSFRPAPQQRLQQPVGMMDALGVARDLGADHAGRVVVVLGAAHPADAAAVDHLDVERAGRGAVVRTGGRCDRDVGADELIHGPPTLATESAAVSPLRTGGETPPARADR
jgi:hypothetical protein